ncbi:roadblock/LC7 domain-containing protein [Streptomyces sp. NPDC020965]|uniref:roadblock/LC7 domain-containing protein n=1 Tax=Streptomyces sp. NPDC020965 TaxID=3365105 RepID=UPI0037B1F51C
MKQHVQVLAVQELLDDKVNGIAGVCSAVVVAEDGLALYWSGMAQESADSRAAIVSGLASLAENAAVVDGTGAVLRTLIEMEDGYFMVVRSADTTHLAVSTTRSANLQTVGFELTRLTQQLATVLEAGRRRPAGPGGAPA